MKELILPDHIPLGQQNLNRWNRIAETYVRLGMAPEGVSLKSLVFDPKKEQLEKVKRRERTIVLLVIITLISIAVLYLWNILLKRQVFKKTQHLKKEIDNHQITQNKLRFALDKYRTLFTSFPHGITVSDRVGNIIETNPVAENLLALSKEEHEQRTIDGEGWRIIRTDGTDMPPDEWASVKALKENRLVSDCEMGIYRPNNEVTWLNVTAAPLPIENHGVVVTYSDITAKKLTQDDLYLHKVIVSSVFEPMAVISKDYIFILVNKAYEDFWCIEKNDIIGKQVSDVMGMAKFESGVKLNVDKCLAGETVSYGCWFDSPQKGRRYMQLNYYPYKNNKSEVIGLINISYDFTEYFESQELLKQQERMLSRTESMAHIGSWQWEIATDTVTWSDELFKIFRRDPNLGTPSFAEHPQLYLPEDMARLEQLVKRAIEKAEPYEIELQAIRSDGVIRHCLAKGFPEKDTTGKVVRLFGFLQDITEKNEALSEIKQLVRDQTIILDNVPAYIYFKDDKNHILRISKRVARITGLPKHEIEGRHSSEIYPEMADKYYKDDLEVIRSGEAKLGIVEPLPLADGETRWLLTDKIPYRGDTGKVEGVIVMATDITGRVETENKLKTSETKFKSLFEYAADAIYLVSEQGKFLEVNRSAEVQTGYSRKELLNMHVGDLDARAVEENDETKIWKNLKPGQTYILKTYHKHKDGHTFPVEINISLIFLNEERVLLGFVRDVTEKEETLQKLKKSEERLSLAFQGANDGLWDWNLETDEVFYSPRWKDMLGYEDHEIKNQLSEWERLIKPENRIKAWSTLNDYLTGKRDNFTCEFQMRHKKGHYVDILSRAFAIREKSDQKPTRVVGTHVDISERKEMERRLQQIQKMESIGNLAGGIAHDFNNILSPIIGMSELLLEDLPANGLEYENAEEIFKAGKRGSELVKQILAFSRQSEKTMIPTRIQSVLKEVLKLCRSTIPINIEIYQDIQADCGLILADSTQIHQVAMNLITNAYHAIEKTKGKISISLTESSFDSLSMKTDLEPGKYAVLSVSDNGHGISPDMINKIFDPYFTTKEKGKGTGLGLSVVYGIMKEHKGDIFVNSEVGKGTTFELYFPLVKQFAHTEIKREDKSYYSGNERILIVDDEPSIANLAERILERLGYQTILKLNGIEAIEAFKSNPDSFDLVISDVAMPKMTGDELARELISIRPDIPIILCTGFSERIDADKAAALGVKGLLMKPIISLEMAEMVRNVLDDTKNS
ncbi:PAS domain-containing hybrid sensor histidine kinase/response regulator [Desulfatibacillum aliphaticivorans]|nr:PAS domain S-box protein [Desulfatibacillum aliphaticivorans]